jgi:hypothetical protein
VKQRRSAGSFVASIAIHVVVVLLLAQIVFEYPIGLFSNHLAPRIPTPEPIHYVTVRPPSGIIGTTTRPRVKPSGGSARPAPLIPPTTIPTPVPPITPPDQGISREAGGKGTGVGVGTTAGPATGVIPAPPDARIRLDASPVMPVQRTPAEAIDSIVNQLYGILVDSATVEANRRKPGDWTLTTKDGKKYGWDQTGIRVGKWTIPNALLALLPLNNLQGNPLYMGQNARSADAIRADVLYQGRLAITEDEFRDAVKRIRERKQKEHDDQQKARPSPSSGKDPATPDPSHP